MLQRQEGLQAQNRVGHQHGEEAENQHGNGVLLPMLFLFGIDAAKAVGERSTGLKRGSSQVRPCASSTCIRYRPSGLVMSKSTPR